MGKPPRELLIFLPDRKASARIGNFVKFKHHALSTLINKPETLYIVYELQTAKSLFREVFKLNPDGLRVYFASFKVVEDYENIDDPSFNNDLIPPGMEDNLTLIFAPTRKNQYDIQVDTKDYFITDPNGQIVNLKNYGDPFIASRWVRHFTEIKWPVLTAIIQETEKDKYETKSILYDIKVIRDLKENFIDEQTPQTLPALAMYFATYHLHETEERDIHKNNQSGKLTLVLSFLDKYRRFYYYQNKDENDPQVMAFGGGGSGDTGVPCPPPNPPQTCSGTSLP